MAKKINAYEIIRSQMQSGREICKNEYCNGAVVSVSLPGSPQAQVVRVEDDTFILEEIVPEEKTPRTFTLTKEKALAFHYVRNENAKVISDASLEAGKFVVNGKEIFLGQLEPKKIIACVKGFVLLAFETPEKDGLVIGSYDVQKDVFNCRLNSKEEKVYTNFFTATSMNGETFVLGQRMETVEQVDEDGIVSVYETCSNPDVYEVYERFGADPILRVAAEKLSTSVVVSDFEIADDGLNVMFVFRYDREMINGKVVDCDLDTDDTKVFRYSFDGMEILSTKHSPRVFVGGKRDYPVVTAKTDNEMKIYYRGSVTEVSTPSGEMNGYDYFAGFEIGVDANGNPQKTYTYANADQNIKRFSLTETDRGTLVEFL